MAGSVRSKGTRETRLPVCVPMQIGMALQPVRKFKILSYLRVKIKNHDTRKRGKKNGKVVVHTTTLTSSLTVLNGSLFFYSKKCEAGRCLFEVFIFCRSTKMKPPRAYTRGIQLHPAAGGV